MAEKKKHTLMKAACAAAAAGATAYAGAGYYIFRKAFDLQHSDFYKAFRLHLPY